MAIDFSLYMKQAGPSSPITPTAPAAPAKAAPIFLTPECSGVTNVDWIVTCDGHKPWHLDLTKDRCIILGTEAAPCTLDDLIAASPHLRRAILKFAPLLPDGTKSRITELIVTDDGLELGRCGTRADASVRKGRQQRRKGATQVERQTRGILQPLSLAELVRPLCDAGATPMGSGTVYSGSRVYLQLKLGEYEVTPGDRVQPYLLITDSYDGSTELEVTLCCTRVVCQNTWEIAQATGDVLASVKHTANMVYRLNPIREVLAAVQAKIEKEAARNRAMAAAKMTDAQRKEMLCALIPVPPPAVDDTGKPREETPGEKRARSRAENEHERIMLCLRQGRGHKLVDQSSVWAMFNAVTERYEHEFEGSETERLQNQMYGNAGSKKDSAYELLCSYLPQSAAA